MSLSKNKIKYIHSLEYKKTRCEENVFIAEGPKLVNDLLEHFSTRLIVATNEWLKTHPKVNADEIVEVSPEELTKASLLKNPQQILAIFEQPKYSIDKEEISSSLSLALDNIQDPGNLGTIIRLADWFGIKNILCSLDTADVYNPKTIQATMGAIARVKVHYIALPEFLSSIKNIPIYGTFLNGENIYQEPLSEQGIIVMGNEGNGIGKEIEALVNHKLYIPNYPADNITSESLNVAIATAVVCAEFRRQMIRY